MEDVTYFQDEICRLSPYISITLLKQLIHSLSKRYFENCSEKSQRNEVRISSVASIERFHGVLLFVDISGFTVLSQKMSVDT